MNPLVLFYFPCQWDVVKGKTTTKGEKKNGKDRIVSDRSVRRRVFRELFSNRVDSVAGCGRGIHLFGGCPKYGQSPEKNGRLIRGEIFDYGILQKIPSKFAHTSCQISKPMIGVFPLTMYRVFPRIGPNF
jgi:hypothetical protein